MPGALMIANAVRSAVEHGVESGSDFILGLIGTLVMTCITYALWQTIRRIHGFGHLVFRDAATPILNLAWMFLLSVFLPSAHLLEFLYPQILVTLYLVITQASQEARAHHVPER